MIAPTSGRVDSYIASYRLARILPAKSVAGVRTTADDNYYWKAHLPFACAACTERDGQMSSMIENVQSSPTDRQFRRTKEQSIDDDGQL